MNNTISNEIATAQVTQIIKQVIRSWEAQNKTITEFFNKYEDDYYFMEIAPGRNRAIYLFGHLIGMNDTLFPMLDMGDKLFPQLEPIFVSSPDKAVADIPAIAILKQYWEKLNDTLSARFATMSAEEWLQRHTKVSEEDFMIDPLRNKLNVLIGRINHQSYHGGQLSVLNRRD